MVDEGGVIAEGDCRIPGHDPRQRNGQRLDYLRLTTSTFRTRSRPPVLSLWRAWLPQLSWYEQGDDLNTSDICTRSSTVFRRRLDRPMRANRSWRSSCRSPASSAKSARAQATARDSGAMWETTLFALRRFRSPRQPPLRANSGGRPIVEGLVSKGECDLIPPCKTATLNLHRGRTRLSQPLQEVHVRRPAARETW